MCAYFVKNFGVYANRFASDSLRNLSQNNGQILEHKNNYEGRRGFGFIQCKTVDRPVQVVFWEDTLPLWLCASY